MATTTPNFGWSVPTSSDLVKNGAVAIETLGDSIDASLVDLKGGTTGQVLAKATGTDMDFTWSTPASGGGMTLLSTTTLTGASTTTATIPGTYYRLYITIESPTNATADGLFRIAPNGNTTSAYSINMAYNNNVASGPTVSSGYINSVVNLARASTLTSLTLTVDNYTNATTEIPYLFYGYIREATPKAYANFQSGVMDLGAAITSFTFSNSGGSFTGGTVKVYGVK
jgi:hypothetical protein